jgi:hypothetical protein
MRAVRRDAAQQRIGEVADFPEPNAVDLVLG